MRVSIDGATWLDVNEVRVEAPDHKDRDFTFTMTMTNDGVMQDWWARSVNEEQIHTGYAVWDDVCDIFGEQQ